MFILLIWEDYIYILFYLLILLDIFLIINKFNFFMELI